MSLGKQSRAWPGSSHVSCLIWIRPVYKNTWKAPHEHKHKFQLCMISLSKQSRPWRAIYHESRPIWIHLVYRTIQRHQWAYSTSSTCTCVWSDISNLHKQTEQTLIRQLSRELPYPDLRCLQKRFKVAARVYSTSSTCVWSDISYLHKQTKEAVIRQFSREPPDLDPPC